MKWVATDTFELDGETFVVDVSPRDRRSSNDDHFIIVKNQHYLGYYERLAKTFKPQGVLELGIFQGGSVVMLDKLFRPEAISALDISPDPVLPLEEYTRRNSHVRTHYASSQTDTTLLRSIVSEELGGQLDFVVDDASHRYDFTKRSFEILFPMLRPGGIYIIEDWAWAHAPAYQQHDHPWADLPALSNLLFEQIVLLGSSSLVEEISIHKGLFAIRKAEDAPIVSTGALWHSCLTRGRDLPAL